MQVGDVVISAKTSYEGHRRDWYAWLERLSPIGHVHLGLRDPTYDPRAVAFPFDQLGLRVSHLHSPRIRGLAEFEAVLPMMVELAHLVHCEYMLFHTFDRLRLGEDVKPFVEADLNPVLKREGLFVLWETTGDGLELARRHASEFGPRHRVCYDVHHCFEDPGSTLRDIAELAAGECALHASNCTREDSRKVGGLPAFDDRGSIDFAKLVGMLGEAGWSGIFDLEYHRPYRDDPDLLKADVDRFVHLFDNTRSANRSQ